MSAVVSGTAKGADQFGERWAEERSIEVLRVPADWAHLGRRAGPARNKVMAESAHGLVAVWDGVSRGTFSMIGLACQHGLRVHVYNTSTGATESYNSDGAVAERWRDAEERASIMEYEGGMSRGDAEKAAGREASAAGTVSASA